jgi:hypothetical protein
VTVTVAAVLTWLFAGLATAGYLAVVALLLADRTQLIDRVTTDPQFRGLNITGNELVAALWVMSAIIILWAVIAMVLAFLAFRGHNWARITLAVSCGFTILFSLLGITSGISLVTLIAAIVVLVLLFTGGAGAWFRPQPSYPSVPGGYGSAPGWPQQSPYPDRPAAPNGPAAPSGSWTTGDDDSTGSPRPPSGGW